ncbi:hypothetical protein [Trinickia violacea]|uniref:hypothetical protein n=1 Tax=Trinickia violacea TaxID=2571746 RepID=UPI0020C7EDD1|nr:hypothetical protein [Trinickia violacea]
MSLIIKPGHYLETSTGEFESMGYPYGSIPRLLLAWLGTEAVRTKGRQPSDLRERTRVKIDHPDLPGAVKQVAAEAVLSIWHSASEASAAELSTPRAEARHQAHEAEVARDQAMAEAVAARQAVESTQAQLEAVRTQLAESGDVPAAERQAHAATEARLQEVRRWLDEASNQLALVKTDLGAEIERVRERAEAADTRAQAHEKRALREID